MVLEYHHLNDYDLLRGITAKEGKIFLFGEHVLSGDISTDTSRLDAPPIPSRPGNSSMEIVPFQAIFREEMPVRGEIVRIPKTAADIVRYTDAELWDVIAEWRQAALLRHDWIMLHDVENQISKEDITAAIIHRENLRNIFVTYSGHPKNFDVNDYPDFKPKMKSEKP